MSAFLKIIKPKYLLLALILFHLVGNIVWILLNNSPPRWDEASHTTRAFNYAYFIESLSVGKPNLNLFTKTFSDAYAPLISMITGVLIYFLPSIKLAQFVGTIFFLLTTISVYLLGKELAKNSWVGLLAATIFSFYQAVYDNSRWLLLDIPLTFFVTLSFYWLLKRKRKW